MSDGVFSRSYRATTLGILLAITAMACEGMAVATVLPSVAFDLGGLDNYGWAFSAFMLASLVGAISAGEAADRQNAMLPARLGFVSFSVGLLIAGLAPLWPILLIGRVVQGFGAGSLMAVSFVAIARAYPEALRPRMLALVSSAWFVPALVGPALAGQVAEHASWRWVFLAILPPVAIAAWMLLPPLGRLFSVDMPVSPNSGRGRVPGRVLTSLRLTAGVALVLFAADLPELPVALLVGALGVLLAVPALTALLPEGTLSARGGLPAAVALRGLLAFGVFGSEALIPLGLTTQRGVAQSLVGLALTAGALAWVLGSWVQDRAEARSSGSLVARAMRVAVGLCLIAVGISGVAATVVLPSVPVELVAVAWAVGGLGMGLAYPATTLTALGVASSGEEGAAAASLQVAETIGTAVGTGTVGALFAMSVHLDRGMSDGLTWGFLLTFTSIVLGLAPAVRMAASGPQVMQRLRPRTATTRPS
ncbi:MAG: MFS transporter [Chloroflexi bacterium]|nr:MFS transporter [Chloroflexota bacterium]